MFPTPLLLLLVDQYEDMKLLVPEELFLKVVK